VQPAQKIAGVPAQRPGRGRQRAAPRSQTASAGEPRRGSCTARPGGCCRRGKCPRFPGLRCGRSPARPPLAGRARCPGPAVARAAAARRARASAGTKPPGTRGAGTGGRLAAELGTGAAGRAARRCCTQKASRQGFAARWSGAVGCGGPAGNPGRWRGLGYRAPSGPPQCGSSR
nr:hypothetical protein [Tanacetum cinerariifolium]